MIDQEFMKRLNAQRIAQKQREQNGASEVIQHPGGGMMSQSMIDAQIEAQERQQKMAETSFNINVMLSIVENEVLFKDTSSEAEDLRTKCKQLLLAYFNDMDHAPITQ